MLPSRGPIQVTLEDSNGVNSNNTARAINKNAINSSDSNNFSQVKILRRPKPVASQSSNNDNNKLLSQQSSTDKLRIVNNHNTQGDNRLKFNNGNGIQQDDRLLNFNIIVKHILPSKVVTTNYDKTNSDSLKNSANDKKIVTKSLKTLSSAINNDNNSMISKKKLGNFQVQQQIDSIKSDKIIDSEKKFVLTKTLIDNQGEEAFNSKNDNNNKLTTTSTSIGSFNSSKQLLKTYQERVDFYAKARLRILGSAFPDDDDDEDNSTNNLTNNNQVNRILNSKSTFNSTDAIINKKDIDDKSLSNNFKSNPVVHSYSSVLAAAVSQNKFNQTSSNNHHVNHIGQSSMVANNNNNNNNNGNLQNNNNSKNFIK